MVRWERGGAARNSQVTPTHLIGRLGILRARGNPSWNEQSSFNFNGAQTINEPHLPEQKDRPRCYVKSSTAQNTFLPIPGLISCAGVTGRWELLFHAQNAVRPYSNGCRDSSKARFFVQLFFVQRSYIVTVIIDSHLHVLLMCKCGMYNEDWLTRNKFPIKYPVLEGKRAIKRQLYDGSFTAREADSTVSDSTCKDTSGKLLREKTCVNFEILLLFMKFGGVASFDITSEQSISLQKSYFPPICKSFFAWNFPPLRYFAASLFTVFIECRLQLMPSGNGRTIDTFTCTRTCTTVHIVYDKCMM